MSELISAISEQTISFTGRTLLVGHFKTLRIISAHLENSLFISPKVLSKRQASHFDYASILIATTHTLPFVESSFDQIVCAFTSNLPNTIHLLSEVRRLLKSKGRLLMIERSKSAFFQPSTAIPEDITARLLDMGFYDIEQHWPSPFFFTTSRKREFNETYFRAEHIHI